MQISRSSSDVGLTEKLQGLRGRRKIFSAGGESAGSVPAVFGQEVAEQRRAMASTLVGSGNDR